MGGDQAGRAVDAHRGLRGLHRQQACFQRHLGDGDDPVAAHGAVALVVHEEDADVGPGGHRRGEDAAVHVGMAPRLEHQRRAQVVEVLLHVPPAGQDGVARRTSGNPPVITRKGSPPV